MEEISGYGERLIGKPHLVVRIEAIKDLTGCEAFHVRLTTLGDRVS